MREWCGCGAGISGTPKQVKGWRKHHQHASPAAASDPSPTSGGSQAENTYPRPTGFIPEDRA